jgi:NADPH:quinone reductase-like Zn-dependent oxidoreductase
VGGTTLRGTPLPQKVALNQEFARQALPRLADGTLRPVVDSVYPIAQAGAAHAAVERNSNTGKIVLRVGA